MNENSKLLSLQILPSSGTPIYRQLMAQIHRLVASKRLSPGVQLPSVRVLAEQLEINPMTVSKAYSGLELQGVLHRIRGKGMVVAENKGRQLGLADRLMQLEPGIELLLMEASQLGVSDKQLLAHLKKLIDKARE